MVKLLWCRKSILLLLQLLLMLVLGAGRPLRCANHPPLLMRVMRMRPAPSASAAAEHSKGPNSFLQSR